MNRWKNYVDTVAAIKNVGIAMVNQIRNPNSLTTDLQGLELLSLSTVKGFHSDISFSSLALVPSGYENWEKFPSAAVEVIRKLLSEFYVLTAIHVIPSSGNKNGEFYPLHSREEFFLHTYVEILRAYEMGEGIYYQTPSDIITVTHGADIPLAKMLFPGDYGIAIDYHMYGFLEQPPVGDIVQARNSIDMVPHVLHLEYGRYPDTLEIHIDTELFSVSQCLAEIQSVCTLEAIPLKIDSALK